ncbi:hypothetical protein Q5752_003799 [Cryptotrichosporon argae]
MKEEKLRVLVHLAVRQAGKEDVDNSPWFQRLVENGKDDESLAECLVDNLFELNAELALEGLVNYAVTRKIKTLVNKRALEKAGFWAELVIRRAAHEHDSDTSEP